MKTIDLGEWTFPSGNVCRATLEKQFPESATIRFAWTTPANRDDLDALTCEVMPGALETALTYAEQMAGITNAIHELAADGQIEAAGTRDGHTVWRATEKLKREQQGGGSTFAAAASHLH